MKRKRFSCPCLGQYATCVECGGRGWYREDDEVKYPGLILWLGMTAILILGWLGILAAQKNMGM